MRHGFTLVETLVALVLLEFAMLALGAGIASTARDLTFARQLAAATASAENRVAILRADPCVATGSASAFTATGTERWRVDADGPWRTIVDSIEFARAGGRRSVVVAQAVTWCGP